MKFLFPIFIPLLLGLIFLQGCCQEKKAERFPKILGESEVQEGELYDETEEFVEETEEDYRGLSVEDRYEDFKRRLEYSDPTELVHLARDVFDQLPRQDSKRRMELAFFLSQAYKKKGDKQSAVEFSEEFQKLFKARMGGKEFQKHLDMKKAAKNFGEKWEMEGELVQD